MGREVEVIDRVALVRRHSPILQHIDTNSPLTVGNGEFAFTADVTGMQTFYNHYKIAKMPLCTMAQWGWDFAVMAMTAVRLGKPDLAIELLLKDTYKNVCVASGNNRQISRDDLPLYLPGNGSLLLAVAMMTAGYKGCDVDTPGFPKDDMWTVEHEGVTALP